MEGLAGGCPHTCTRALTRPCTPAAPHPAPCPSPPPQENYFLDDGAYGALKIVMEMVRRRLAGEGDIGDLLQDLRWAGGRVAWLGGWAVGGCSGRWLLRR